MKTSATVPSLSKLYAEGDKLFGWAIYNDTTASLSIGMPLYVDITDAAEFNIIFTTTALLSGANFGIATAGKAVLGTNANIGPNATCIGVFYPQQGFGYKPTKGEVVRVLVYGRGVVSTTVAATGSGNTALTVGAKLIANSTFTSAIVGTAAASIVIGTAVATGPAVTINTVIQGLPGTGTVTKVHNAFVNLC